MTTFTNSLAQSTYGISSTTNAGVLFGIAPSTNSQFLRCIGSNAFDFNSNAQFSAGGGIIQITNFPAPNPGGGSPLNVTVVGTQSSVYNAGALFYSFQFTPLSTTSQIYACLNLNVDFVFGQAGNSVIWCGYLNQTGSPVISAYQANQSSSSGMICSAQACALIGSNFVGPQTFSICAFRGTTASTPQAPFNSSSIEIWEKSSLPVNPISFLVSTATAVLCLSFPLALNSSLAVQGSWEAFNSTTTPVSSLGNNGGTFFFVGIRGSGNVALANDNVVRKELLAFGTGPSIQFLANTSTQAIEVYAVGVTGSTYNFNFNFTTN